MLLGLPITLASLVTGYFFFLRKIPQVSGEKTAAEHHFLKLISPITIVITVYAILLIFFPGISKLSKYLPMTIGLLAAMLSLQIMRPLTKEKWKSVLLSKKALTMVLIVILVRIYGAFIEAHLPGGTLLMEQMRVELNNVGIPLIILVLVIPFISGITTGVSVGFVGASMPIVISLLGSSPNLSHLLSTVILAFTFGFMGVMLSPVHVCLIVTNEYFKTNLAKSLTAIIPPVLVLMAVAAVYAAVIWFI